MEPFNENEQVSWHGIKTINVIMCRCIYVFALNTWQSIVYRLYSSFVHDVELIKHHVLLILKYGYCIFFLSFSVGDCIGNIANIYDVILLLYT